MLRVHLQDTVFQSKYWIFLNIRQALLASIALMAIGSSGAMAQQVLDGTTLMPDHQSIRANKVLPPGVVLNPTAPIIPDPRISTQRPGKDSRDAYWRQMKKIEARASARTRSAAGSRSAQAKEATGDAALDGGGIIVASEEEVGQGENDTQADAERIRRLGTGRGDRSQAIISGSLGEGPANRLLTQAEDDGAIPVALETGIVGGPDHVSFAGAIGDGPLPGVVSDYDFVRVFMPAGTTFDIAVRTPDPFGDLDPFVTFYLPDGTLIFQQDDGGEGYDTFVRLTADIDLEFLMAIGGFGAFEPADPFNSTGGSVTGLIGSEGSYEFEMRVFPPPGEGDVDFFSFYLDKGDVLGAAVRNTGAPDIQIFNASESLEKGASGFGSFAVPQSPLPIDGSSVVDYVVEKSGIYAIALGTSFGDYELELGVYRSEFERNKRRIQLIWLDYNGGPVSKEPWFGFPLVTDHTPFRDFLPAWDLSNHDRDVRRITRKITREARDNLKRELQKSRENRNFGVVVLGNDGTGRWNWIEDHVEAGSFTIFGITYEISVVEVSGTIDESFISTIGIASTIDPGNYAVNDAALVLLDVLSAPPSGISGNFTFSLNDVALAPGTSKEKLVVTVLGNIIAHEAGHYIGNFHTDGFNLKQNLMDEGPGGLFNLAGIGPSGVFGESDQIDIGFFDDLYSVREGFLGDENTTVNSAFGLSFFPFNIRH